MTQLAVSLPPSERLVFESPSVAIAQVRCPPTSAHFRDCGGARTCCVVFPRSAVIVRRPDVPAFVEDPTVVSFYNRDQPYERQELGREGDRCDWFAFAPGIVRDAIRQVDPKAADDERRPWRIAVARCTSDIYRRQRLLFERAKRDEGIEPLAVEEAAVRLLADVVHEAYGRQPRIDTSSRRAYDLTEAARRLLALHHTRNLSLAQIAASLETSAFHLCHVFRRVHGTSIHRYRTDLRIRRAIERLSSEADLGRLACELGFSTHSHFTAAFRRAFGATPSAVRSAMAQASSERPRPA